MIVRYLYMQVNDAIAIISQYLPEPQATFVNGVTFGSMRGLDSDLHRAFITTGTIHIAALSGMNISIVAAGTILLLSRWFSKRVSLLLAMIATIGFIYFVGPTASLVRAGVMALLSYSSTLLGRQYAPITALSLTAVGMLILYPSYASESGFWLSILATLGILLFPYYGLSKQAYPNNSANHTDAQQSSHAVGRIDYLDSIVQALWHAVGVDLHTTLAAQVFTYPYIFILFHRLSLIAPLANILIGFVIPPVMVLGITLAIVGSIMPIVAYPVGWVLWVLSSYVITVVRLLADVPFAGIEW